MRITGGKWCRRQLKAPGAKVRPTQDRVREAVFATLSPSMADCRFLDLFAGSGAVGLEAASRGAGSVVMVEHDRSALAVLRDNVQAFDTGQTCRVVPSDVLRFIAAPRGATFDIIYADPPYDELRGQGGWCASLLDALARSQLLTPAGIFIMEQSRRQKAASHAAWETLDERRYGETVIFYFRKITTGGRQT